MKFFDLQPFVPSGSDFSKAKAVFSALGFDISWEADGMAGFQKDGCRFILQQYDNREFAENFMLTVNVDDAAGFYREMQEKGLAEKFGVRLSAPAQQPYGLEVNLIDLAGVCWHFVEA